VTGCTDVSGAPVKKQKERVDFLGVFFGSLRFFERVGGAKCELVGTLTHFLGLIVLPTYLVETMGV
jgi:hypothetical protein